MYDSIKLYILYTDEPESFIIMWYYNVTPSNVGYRSDLGLPKDTPLLGYKDELSSAFCVFQAEIWASLSSCTVIKPIMSTCILGKRPCSEKVRLYTNFNRSELHCLRKHVCSPECCCVIGAILLQCLGGCGPSAIVFLLPLFPGRRRHIHNPLCYRSVSQFNVK